MSHNIGSNDERDKPNSFSRSTFPIDTQPTSVPVAGKTMNTFTLFSNQQPPPPPPRAAKTTSTTLITNDEKQTKSQGSKDVADSIPTSSRAAPALNHNKTNRNPTKKKKTKAKTKKSKTTKQSLREEDDSAGPSKTSRRKLSKSSQNSKQTRGRSRNPKPKVLQQTIANSSNNNNNKEESLSKSTLPTSVGSSSDELHLSTSKVVNRPLCEAVEVKQPPLPRRVSFGPTNAFPSTGFDCDEAQLPRRVSFGPADTCYSSDEEGNNDTVVPLRTHASRVKRSGRSLSDRPSLRLDRSGGRRTAFAKSRNKRQNQKFRISKNPTKMKTERIEAFFYNHGMEIALGVLYLALNILVACHGAYQFTESGGWTTEDDLLRVTLPIARGGGRLVTLNCALLLLTACKYLWTCVRTHVAPFLPIGFPIDNVMPKYHKIVARTAIVGGCVVHTLPQIANYATRSIAIEHDQPVRGWTFGNGFATKQLLLTGTLLTVIFSTFFLTTLPSFRKTATGFRWFWFFHIGGIATAYPLLLLHGTCRGHPVFLYFALLPLALYLFDIAMRRSKISTTKVLRWKTHEDEGQRITELVVECPANFSYTPGQYAELRFLPISSSEWHPFTIASAPNEMDSGNKTSCLIFYIKSTGRWTDALYNYASAFDLSKAKASTTIQIRGPHGAPAMNYFEYKHIVVIGSGVGVTPLLSIWKYLVARGRTMVYHKTKTTENICESAEFSVLSSQHLDMTNTSGFFVDDESLPAFCETETIVNTSRPWLHSACIFLEKVFESMAVSMSLLVLFVLGETLTFVLQMFGYGVTANSLGSWLSFNALVVHGTTVLVSGVALGWSNYFKLFRCWLECTIIFVDAIALWFSVRNRRLADDVVLGAKHSPKNTAYFVFFGAVVILHALRIFHIFYMTLKPRSRSVITTPTSSITKDSRLSISRNSRNINQEICSIDGILINRMYSNMKFAARSLLRPIIEDGLTDLFSMEFYGTREKSKDRDHSEHSLISDMIDVEHGIDIRCKMCEHQHDEYFHPGRPNWNKIFLKAMSKAHHRNPKGESVGVFFCGSPAIAKDLQAAAAKVTAQHQFAVKHLDGKPCRCKLIVHSENF